MNFSSLLKPRSVMWCAPRGESVTLASPAVFTKMLSLHPALIWVTVQCQGDPVAPEFSLRRGDSNFVKPAIIPLYSLQEIKETFNE